MLLLALEAECGGLFGTHVVIDGLKFFLGAVDGVLGGDLRLKCAGRGSTDYRRVRRGCHEKLQVIREGNHTELALRPLVIFRKSLSLIA